jgi:hypothetical protein
MAAITSLKVKETTKAAFRAPEMDMMALGWRIIISMLARIEGMGIDVQVIRFQFSKNEPHPLHLIRSAAINQDSICIELLLTAHLTLNEKVINERN